MSNSRSSSQFPSEIESVGKNTTTERVLVIDDDPVVGRMIEKALEGSSARVLQEFGIPEYGAYDFQDVDCIVLDYMMPVRNGIEILQEIRAVSQDVPVLFLTGFGDPDLAEKSLALGANRFVAKPISPVAVKAMIEELVAGTRSEVAPSESARTTPPVRQSKSAHISRQFFAVTDSGELVEGEIVRFGTRSAVVEMSNSSEISAGDSLNGISFRFGRIQVESSHGIVRHLESLSDERSEVEILVPELWGVVERSISERGDEGANTDGFNLSGNERMGWLEKEQQMLPADFRIAVHELVGVLQVVEQDGTAYELSKDDNGEPVQEFRDDADFVKTTSERYAPLFWSAMQRFEAAAKPLLRGEHSSLAKEYARKHLYPLALSSPFLSRVVEKPIGVPGDYGMLGQILGNPLEGYSVYDRVFNSWILGCGAAAAYRNRVNLLHREIVASVGKASSEGHKAEILSMASGVAYEVQRYIESPDQGKDVDFVLVDFSPETLEEAQRQYRTYGAFPEGVNVELHQSSVIDLANASRQVKGEGYRPGSKYDLVYCAGLFDYLSDRLVTKVSQYLFGLLRPGGKLVLSNYTTNNPIIAWMTLVMDWELIYRSEEDFGDLIQTALPDHRVELETDEGGVEVYALVTN